MDFKRIEAIFLAAFCVLNIFLFASYQDSRVAGENNGPDLNTSTDLITRLKSDNIKYEKNFSTKRRSGYYLAGENSDLKKISKKLNGQTCRKVDGKFISYLDKSQMITASKMKSLREKVRKFLDQPRNVLHGQEYLYLPETSQAEEQLMYVQNWEGIPFNDDTAKITFFFDKNKSNPYIITGYEQDYLENIEPLREKQELISEYDAVSTLYMNMRIPANSSIEWTKLAYSKVLTAQNKNIYIPVWFVGIQINKNTLQIERVNAFTNAILTTNISDMKN